MPLAGEPPKLGKEYMGSVVRSIKVKKDKPNANGKIKHYLEIHCANGMIFKETKWLLAAEQLPSSSPQNNAVKKPRSYGNPYTGAPSYRGNQSNSDNKLSTARKPSSYNGGKPSSQRGQSPQSLSSRGDDDKEIFEVTQSKQRPTSQSILGAIDSALSSKEGLKKGGSDHNLPPKANSFKRKKSIPVKSSSASNVLNNTSQPKHPQKKIVVKSFIKGARDGQQVQQHQSLKSTSSHSVGSYKSTPTSSPKTMIGIDSVQSLNPTPQSPPLTSPRHRKAKTPSRNVSMGDAQPVVKKHKPSKKTKKVMDSVDEDAGVDDENHKERSVEKIRKNITKDENVTTKDESTMKKLAAAKKHRQEKPNIKHNDIQPTVNKQREKKPTMKQVEAYYDRQQQEMPLETKYKVTNNAEHHDKNRKDDPLETEDMNVPADTSSKPKPKSNVKTTEKVDNMNPTKTPAAEEISNMETERPDISPKKKNRDQEMDERFIEEQKIADMHAALEAERKRREEKALQSELQAKQKAEATEAKSIAEKQATFQAERLRKEEEALQKELQAKKEEEEAIEAKRIADEQAALEAERQRIFKEKQLKAEAKAKKQAEAKRYAEEQAALEEAERQRKEAEEAKILEEKRRKAEAKAKKQAEAKRYAEEQAAVEEAERQRKEAEEAKILEEKRRKAEAKAKKQAEAKIMAEKQAALAADKKPKEEEAKILEKERLKAEAKRVAEEQNAEQQTAEQQTAEQRRKHEALTVENQATKVLVDDMNKADQKNPAKKINGEDVSSFSDKATKPILDPVIEPKNSTTTDVVSAVAQAADTETKTKHTQTSIPDNEEKYIAGGEYLNEAEGKVDKHNKGRSMGTEQETEKAVKKGKGKETEHEHLPEKEKTNKKDESKKSKKGKKKHKTNKKDVTVAAKLPESDCSSFEEFEEYSTHTPNSVSSQLTPPQDLDPPTLSSAKGKLKHNKITVDPHPGFAKILGFWGEKEGKDAIPFSPVKSTRKIFDLEVKADDTKNGQRAKLRNIFSEKIEFDPDFQPPVFEKTQEEKKLIRQSFEDNFAFSDLTPSELEPMVDAFEKIEYEKGATIAEQGSPDCFFYIVQDGEVTFDLDGDMVAEGKTGDVFGELSLVYSCDRATTVKAEDRRTALLRLHQTSYKHIRRNQFARSVSGRMKLLKNIPFFKDASDTDLAQLSAAMNPHIFEANDNLTSTFKEAPFCLIQEGTVSTTSDSSKLGPGGAFGEENLSRKGLGLTNVTALTDGVAYTIDRPSFEKVFGDMNRLAQKSLDKKILRGLRAIRAAKVSADDLDLLARQIADKPFSAGEEFFVTNENMVPSLYIVRKGSVKTVRKNGKEEIITAGGYFGHEYLMISSKGGRDTVPEHVKAKYSATAMEDSVCGVLTLQECMAVFGGDTATTDLDKGQYIALEDLNYYRILGEGHFGVVWLVSNSKATTPDPYALKIQMLDDDERDAPECIKEEITIMRKLQYPFIVRVINTYEEEDAISMLLGLAPGGELFDQIHYQLPNGLWDSGIGEEKGRFYCSVIADTLAFMHVHGYIYRDLKPENVLLDKDGYPLITDFGFTKHLKKGEQTYTMCGTPNYLPPEIVKNVGHGPAADNWSLGVLIYEVVQGENPFWYEGLDQVSLFHAICEEDYYPLPDEGVSDELCDLILRLLEKNPSKRLGSFREKDILNHPWFSGIDPRNIRKKQLKAPWVPKPVELGEPIPPDQYR